MTGKKILEGEGVKLSARGFSRVTFIAGRSTGVCIIWKGAEKLRGLAIVDVHHAFAMAFYTMLLDTGYV